MASLAYFLLVLPLLNDIVQCWPSLALNDLSPPPGNSLKLKAKTYNGSQAFECVEGNWKLLNAASLLVDADNASLFVGSYFFQDVDGPLSEGTWSLSNTAEEYAESGYPASEVSGTRIAGNNCSDVLSEASNHRYIGRASLVSYIQTFSTKVHLSPGSICDVKNCSRVELPFEAEYWLWTQDRLPPKDIPVELRAPKGRVVEGFFAQGQIPYVFNGTSWEQKGWSAMLYDVPGGACVGHHYMKADDQSLVWELFNPNGWGVSGKHEREPVQVAENCVAWSLSVVMSNWGNASLLGPFSHVQMLSTRGGMPPSPLTTTRRTTDLKPVEPTVPSPSRGDAWNSTFSAVFWFYTG